MTSLFEQLLNVVNQLIYKVPDNIQVTIIPEIQKINALSDKFEQQGQEGNKEKKNKLNLAEAAEELAKKVKNQERVIKDLKNKVSNAEAQYANANQKIDEQAKKIKEYEDLQRKSKMNNEDKNNEIAVVRGDLIKIQALLKNKENVIVQMQKQINQQNNQILLNNKKSQESLKTVQNQMQEKINQLQEQKSFLEGQIKQQQDYAAEVIRVNRQNEDIYKNDLNTIIQKHVKSQNSQQQIIQRLQQQVNQLNNVIQTSAEREVRLKQESQLQLNAIQNLKNELQQQQQASDAQLKVIVDKAVAEVEEKYRISKEERAKMMREDELNEVVNQQLQKIHDQETEIRKMKQLLDIKKQENTLHIQQRTNLESALKNQASTTQSLELLLGNPDNVSLEYNQGKMIQNMDQQITALRNVNHELEEKIKQYQQEVKYLQSQTSQDLKLENQLLKEKMAAYLIQLSQQEREQLEKKVTQQLINSGTGKLIKKGGIIQRAK